jgi:uncharacterized delta-60 repeat protein
MGRRPTAIAIAIAMVIVIVATPGRLPAAGAGGTYDPAFGAGGVAVVATGAGPGGDRDPAMAVDRQGRTVVVRSVPFGDRVGGRWSLTRLQPDGRPDPSFGVGGVSVVPSETVRQNAFAAVDAAGRTVVTATGDDTSPRCCLGVTVARFTPDGSKDAAFAGDGETFIDVPNVFASPTRPVVASDGTVFAAVSAGGGHVSPCPQTVWLLRLAPDGRPAPGFGSGGMKELATGCGLAAVDLVDVTPERMVVSVIGDRLQLLALRPDGTRDATFGVGGVVDLDAVGLLPGVLDVDQQGRLVMLSREDPNRTQRAPRPVISRFTTDGRVDPSFGAGGTTVIDDRRLVELRSIAALDDGSVMAVGAHTAPVAAIPAAVRLSSTGTWDRTWGCRGVAVLETALPDLSIGATVRARNTSPVVGIRSEAGREVVAAVPSGTAAQPGYHVLTLDGRVRPFGRAAGCGSTQTRSMAAIAEAPGGDGYWVFGADGSVFAFGAAAFEGSLNGRVALNEPIVAGTPTPTGRGYWLFAADGGVFTFGDARFLGSMGGRRLNEPIAAGTPTPTGRGYWLFAADGGVFTFGDARFLGSMGGRRLNQPIVAGAATTTGRGYWLAAADGGIFTFGDGRFHGSLGDRRLAQPIVGMAPTATGRGYHLVARDGGIFTFGDGVFAGSLGGLPISAPAVAISVPRSA